LHQILSRHFYAKRKMWTVVLIGTAGTFAAIPVWLGLHTALGVEGFALASTLVMTAYALGLLVAWGFDSGWAPVRLLIPSLLRGLIAAAIAALIAYPLVQAMFGATDLSIVGGLIAALVGALTTVAAFLGVSLLLRAPELTELRGRS
jgi:peptidoglycan biosynthesis protein MviN/MurJ (putative lipid II flippase)